MTPKLAQDSSTDSDLEEFKELAKEYHQLGPGVQAAELQGRAIGVQFNQHHVSEIQKVPDDRDSGYRSSSFGVVQIIRAKGLIVMGISGGPGRTRTCDQGIMNS